MGEDRSIFDRERSGSLFDRDDRSLFAVNSEQNGVSRVQYDDDTYKILVNVESYKPEELVIKTIDNTVHVEATTRRRRRTGEATPRRASTKALHFHAGSTPTW